MMVDAPLSDARPAIMNCLVTLRMNPSPANHAAILPASAGRPPSRDEISECARRISTECGVPEVRDGAIWLEAERRLMAARQTPGFLH